MINVPCSLLQQLWDYVFIIQSSIEDWKTTPWRKVDVENMDIECKKFAKDIRLLDKEMRSWDTFIKLEATVKNMLTSLRAVGELQNPAIRERHWDQLMNSTKVSYYLAFCYILPLHHRSLKGTVILQRQIYNFSLYVLCVYITVNVFYICVCVYLYIK